MGELIIIADNSLEVEGTKSLAQVLGHNRTLKTLNLAHNKMKDAGLDYLQKGIVANASLEHLNIQKNGLEELHILQLLSTIRLTLEIIY